MTTVSDALRQRISTREFLPTPLPGTLVREILEVARWSPSGGNVQPWKVIVVSGAERAAVTAIGRTISPDGANSEEGDNPIYPAKLWEPYRTRRFRLGELMYAQAQAEQGAAGAAEGAAGAGEARRAKDDDVVDADFKEVKRG